VGSPRNPLARPPAIEKPTFGAKDGLGCLAVIALCAVIGYVAHGYLPPSRDGSPLFPLLFACGIGTLAGFGLYSLASVALGFGRGASGRTALYARAKSDGPPEDGQFIVATGAVRTDRPLTSPLGGVACALYDYRMFTRSGEGTKRQNDVPVYWGWGAQPFRIDSRTRSYPVLGIPLPIEKAGTMAGDDVVARARSYVRATGWETVEYKLLGTMDTVFQRLGDDSTTGSRRDFALPNDTAPDVAVLRMEETTLPIGATASVFGTWSATHGAINGPPWPLPGSRAMVALGGPESLNGQPGVPSSTTGYVVGAVVMTALAGGLFWLATIILPTIEM
jgi:hypothetical protein